MFAKAKVAICCRTGTVCFFKLTFDREASSHTIAHGSFYKGFNMSTTMCHRYYAYPSLEQIASASLVCRGEGSVSPNHFSAEDIHQ